MFRFSMSTTVFHKKIYLFRQKKNIFSTSSKIRRCLDHSLSSYQFASLQRVYCVSADARRDSILCAFRAQYSTLACHFVGSPRLMLSVCGWGAYSMLSLRWRTMILFRCSLSLYPLRPLFPSSLPSLFISSRLESIADRNGGLFESMDSPRSHDWLALCL